MFTGERINPGLFGLVIFLALASLYALIRKLLPTRESVRLSVREQELKDIYQHPSYSDFIAEDPDRTYIYKEDIPSRFNDWINSEKEAKQVS
jgi:hypothetical protein